MRTFLTVFVVLALHSPSRGWAEGTRDARALTLGNQARTLTQTIRAGANSPSRIQNPATPQTRQGAPAENEAKRVPYGDGR